MSERKYIFMRFFYTFSGAFAFRVLVDLSPLALTFIGAIIAGRIYDYMQKNTSHD